MLGPEESPLVDDPPLPEIVSQDTGGLEISPPPTPPLHTSSLVVTSDEPVLIADVGELDAVVEGEALMGISWRFGIGHCLQNGIYSGFTLCEYGTMIPLQNWRLPL